LETLTISALVIDLPVCWLIAFLSSPSADSLWISGKLDSFSFDDIDELSEMFAEVDNNLMGSVGAVDAYIKKNPDNNKNNARRNKMLKEYINKRTNEYDNEELIISGRLPSFPAQFPVPMQSL
jgi:myo-inositol-1-phosphate synthase